MAARTAVRALDFSELEALACAVEEGSISRAALRLHLSTPALAKRIRQLEAVLGGAVLVRSTRGVVPTALGRTTYTAARRLLDDRAALMASVHGDGRRDPLRIDGARRLVGTLAPRGAEGLLRETEALLSALFHASSDGLVISSLRDGRIHEVNDAFCRILGASRDELIGRRSVEVGFWADAADRAAVVDEVRRRGSAGPQDIVVTRTSGRACRLEARFQLRNLGGEDRLIAALRDVTRERTERESLAAGRRLQALTADLTAALAAPADPDAVVADCVELVRSGLGVERVCVVDAGAQPSPGGAPDEAALVAPIPGAGLLCAFAREPREFDAPERDFLRAAANVIAAALGVPAM